MPVATIIISTSSHPHRSSAYNSHSFKYHANEVASVSTISVSSQGAEKSLAGRSRHSRVKAREHLSQERCSRDKRAMSSQYPRRTYSDSRSKARETHGKEPRVVVRDERRDSESEHRHPRRRSGKEDGKESERVHVYRVHRRSEGEADRSKASTLRRSTTNAGEASGTRHERQRTEDRESRRRHSERRSSHHEEKAHTPLRHEKRSIADHVPESPRDRAPVTRNATARETVTASFSRPPLKRSNTSSRQERPLSSAQPSSPPPVREKRERAPSTTSRARPASRPSSILGSIFGLPVPVKPAAPAKPPKPEPQVECITCLSDDIPMSKSALLPCKHRMCNSCLRRIFTLSTTDPQHMPPTCCTKQCIDLKHVEKLFDYTFKRKWNRKYKEYTTKNRIYCPARGCGSWIRPAHIYTDTSGGANGGRKYGKCQRCKMKVCCTCNNKWHSSRECPKDAATQEFIKIAKEEGWQRCFNCSATVELKEGCNHMTCRCRAEFCMICGLKWKTCDCPWFNYDAVEADRLAHMNVPQLRRVPIPIPMMANNNNPARGYQEEMDRRREQELRDEALARRIQIFGLDPEADLIDLNNAPFIHAAAAAQNHQHHHHHHHVPADWAQERPLAETRPPPPPPPQQQHRHHPPPPPPQPQPQPHRPPEPLRQPPVLLRQHSTASRHYNTHPSTRPSERVVPRRVVTGHGYQVEAERHRPLGVGVGVGVAGMGMGMGRRNSVAIGSGLGDVNNIDNSSNRRRERESLLAGIGEGRTAQGRVDEWRRHVGPGPAVGLL